MLAKPVKAMTATTTSRAASVVPSTSSRALTVRLPTRARGRPRPASLCSASGCSGAGVAIVIGPLFVPSARILERAAHAADRKAARGGSGGGMKLRGQALCLDQLLVHEREP